MKRILGTLTVLLITVIVHAQTTVKGKVRDPQNQPLAGATITLQVNNKTFTSITDGNGNYQISKVPENTTAKLTVQFVSKKTFEQQVNINQNNPVFNIKLED